MAFFPRIVNNPDTSFTPLFRFLEDFDQHTRQSTGSSAGGSNGRRGLFQWQPKFDIRETGDAYELHGELPGVSKENVEIEFPEPQTIHIRGRVERTYKAGSPPAGHITEGGEGGGNSHKATVEEEAEDKNKNQDNNNKSGEVAKKNDKKQTDNAKYWLTERNIGEFSRSFTFPSRVDQDAVSATFKDGILTVVVPKAKKHESRRITIN